MTSLRFKSDVTYWKKPRYFIPSVLLAVTVLFFIGFGLAKQNGINWISAIPMAVFLSQLIAIRFRTFYTIDDTYCHLYAGYSSKKIKIKNIRLMEINVKRKIGQISAGVASKGINIHYNQFSKIFLCPEDQEGFINALIAINPNIQVNNQEL